MQVPRNTSTSPAGARPPLTRRRFLGGAAGLTAASIVGVPLLLSACGGDDADGGTAAGPATSGDGRPESLGKAALQLLWVKNVQFGGSYIADAKGYYADEGLEVELLPGGPGVAALALVNAGTALVGMAAADAIAAAKAQGDQSVIIAACYQKSPVCIISSADDPLVTPQHMAGRKIGVGASSLVSFNAFLSANGMSADELTIVPIQFDPTPLYNGEVDGYYGFATNEAVTLELRGFPTHRMMFDDFKLPQLSQLYVAKRDSLEDAEARARVVALLRGDIRGWQDAVADPGLAATLAVETYGKDLDLDPEQQRRQAEAQVDLIVGPDTEANGLFWMSEERIEGTLESLEQAGIPADASMFDTSVLAEVYGGKNRL